MQFDYLDPKQIKLELAPDGMVRALLPDRCGMEVQVLRAFPLSHERQFITLRDGKNEELGMVESLDDLDSDSVALAEAELRRRYFLPKITGILAATERFGSSQWEVETDRGPRTLSTGVVNEAISEIAPGRYLITDSDGNRFEIPKLSELDIASRARFLGKA